METTTCVFLVMCEVTYLDPGAAMLSLCNFCFQADRRVIAVLDNALYFEVQRVMSRPTCAVVMPFSSTSGWSLPRKLSRSHSSDTAYCRRIRAERG